MLVRTLPPVDMHSRQRVATNHGVTPRELSILAVHAVVGWVYCGALIGIGRQLMPLGDALIVHAIGAPIGFALLSWHYHRSFGFTSPVTTASLFLAIVVALDLLVVAVVVESSLAMFRSVVGTWLPFALIFAASYGVGAAVERERLAPAQRPARPAPFWAGWLRVVTLGLAAFGLALVLAPGIAWQGFSLLLYADPQRIAGLGAAAVAYVGLVHAVLGAVLFGWAVALFLIVRGPFARGERGAWDLLALSIAAWFVSDTAYSLWSGFWPNAVLNGIILALLAVPLAMTWRVFRSSWQQA